MAAAANAARKVRDVSMMPSPGVDEAPSLPDSNTCGIGGRARFRQRSATPAYADCTGGATIHSSVAAVLMRLFMQTQPAGADAPRYYQLVLQQDLLGGWTLFREWGQQGSRAISKREVYLERDAALNAFENARDAQLKRGFHVMFSQGFEGPHAR